MVQRAIHLTWLGVKGVVAALLTILFLIWWTWKPEPMTVDRFETDGSSILLERTVLREFGSRWTAEVNGADGGTLCASSGNSTFTQAEGKTKVWPVASVFGPGCATPLPRGARIVIRHYPLGGDLADVSMSAVVE